MIMVTGFGPYKEEFNASAELVASLKTTFLKSFHILKAR